MLEEGLISFETAKLAKQKGFPQDYYPCFGDDGNIHTVAYFNTSYPDANSYFQSTQSLLQKWLRDIHNLHVIVNPYDDKGHWGLSNIRITNFNSYENLMEMRDFREKYEKIPFNSYEEALERGLIEALNRI